MFYNQEDEENFLSDKKERINEMKRLQKERKRREAGIRTIEQRLSDDREKVLKKAEIVKHLLEENPNLSLRQLANKTGYSRSTVQRLKKLI